MGKGRDKRKKGKDQSKAKSNHMDKKLKWNSDEDEDLDLMLEEFAKKRTELAKVTELESETGPSSRANFSMVPNPLNPSELVMFGGEYYDGERCSYYADLYRYNIEKGCWRQMNCAAGPKPRSSHQMVACSNGKLLMFGGEFGSTKDTKFLHYKDLWLLDPKSFSWSEVEVSGPSPAARSGHRMVSWRHFVILFGGFQDSGAETRYLDDLWFFDCRTQSWQRVDAKGERPIARSGFVFGACEEGAVLYGGYHIVKGSGKNSGTGTCLSDCWLLKMPREDGRPAQWERKKVSNCPSLRSGATGVVHKNKMLMFGGIVDENVGDEYIHGTCKSELYELNLEKLSSWKLVEILGKQPVGRFNCAMAGCGRDIVIARGLVEIGDNEIFLDDIFKFNAERHSEWVELKPLTIDLSAYKIDDASDDEDDGDEEESEEDESDSDDSSEYSSDDSTTEPVQFCHPRPTNGQTLRDYFSENIEYFLLLVDRSGIPMHDKQRRGQAFDNAQAVFEEYRFAQMKFE